VRSSSELVTEVGSAGTDWIDVLQVENADVLARYETNELGADAAATSHAFGAGRVTYVGTVPNPALGRSIGRWLVPDTQKSAWMAGDTVTVSTGTTETTRIAFISNWSATPTTVTAPTAATDLVSGATYAAGDVVPLGRRDVVVLEVTDHSAE
jgi:beta-galactosidase